MHIEFVANKARAATLRSRIEPELLELLDSLREADESGATSVIQPREIALYERLVTLASA